ALQFWFTSLPNTYITLLILTHVWRWRADSSDYKLREQEFLRSLHSGQTGSIQTKRSMLLNHNRSNSSISSISSSSSIDRNRSSALLPKLDDTTSRIIGKGLA